MTILYRIRALVRWLFRRDEIERALDTDLADYIERSVTEKVQAGMSEKEARRAARIDLGGVEQTKDSVRATLSYTTIENTLADLKLALRTLSRQKTFTAVAALTLALGIGVNVAIYSLAEQFLLRPLPVPEPDRLVNLSDPGPKTVGRLDPLRPPTPPGASVDESGGPETVFSYPMFRDLERAQEPFVGLAAHHTLDVRLVSGEQARNGNAILVSGSYFSVLGLRPALGRLLGSQDDEIDGTAESVVLSYAYWQSAFAGDPDVLGRTLVVNEVPLIVVGVAPRGFSGTTVVRRVLDSRIPTVFVPITIESGETTGLAATIAVPNHERRDFYWVHLFARLKPGVTREAAAVAINPLYRAILSEVEAPLLSDVDEQQREAFRSKSLVLEPGARGQTLGEILSAMRLALLLLFAVSGLVLLICCANVTGLMLIRATARTGEMAVRASMGASRGRLASLLAAESLVLALPAALLSLPIALLILRGPSRVPGIPDSVSDVLELFSNVNLSATAALVAIGVAVVSALAVGLFPLRGLIRTEPGKTLQAYGARQTTAKGVTRFRATLATAQVALSMALLGITFVLSQSVATLTRIDLGLDLDSVATFSISSPPRRWTSAADWAPIAEALEAIPGVSSMASSSPALLRGPALPFSVSVRGLEADPLPVGTYTVSPDFFRMFGIELLAGRELDDTDSADSGYSAAVVSQRFVERLGLTPDDILGRTIEFGRGFGTSLIVGVVADVRSGRITEEIEPRMFLPGGGNTYYVRSARPPEDLMNTVRATVARVQPDWTVSSMSTMEQQFLDSIAIQRFAAGGSSAFAVLATALAALGLYGVLAYSVAQRSREIGLRLALGAPAVRIRGMVLRQVAHMAAIGVVLGAIAAWLLGLAAQSLLFGVEAGDPLALAGAAALLTVVMLGAAYIPARRASRVDPMSVLRYE
jgi:putative ABC transport system permease protein